MAFCRKCGKQIPENVMFCKHCGQSVSSPIRYQRAPAKTAKNAKQPEKKRNIYKLLAALIIIFALGGCSCVFLKTLENFNYQTQSSGVPVIFDANEYCQISIEEMKNKLGEPEAAEKWHNQTSIGNFELVSYDYNIDDLHFTFIAHDDTIVKIYCVPNTPWEMPDNFENVFAMFGITPTKDMQMIANTGYVCRYATVSDSIQEFEIYNSDFSKAKDRFDMIRITYNNKFFE